MTDYEKQIDDAYEKAMADADRNIAHVKAKMARDSKRFWKWFPVSVGLALLGIPWL